MDYQSLIQEIKKVLAPYKASVKRPAKGALIYDYLVPGSIYQEQWDWDAFFMGVALAAEIPSEAIYLRNIMLNFMHSAREDGYVPGCVTPKGPDIRLNQVKPFVAQGVYLSSRFLGDYDWISPYYHTLKKVVLYRENNLWNKKYDLGVWFNSMESGVDNNVSALEFLDKTVVATDINTHVSREYKSMSFIASELGRNTDAKFFRERAEHVRININKYLWDDKDQSYYNLDSTIGNLIRRMTFSNFVPLYASIASEKNGQSMIQRYLLNPKKMWSPYGGRTLAKDDPSYNNVNMIKPHSNWQGPVWPIANYFYLHALMRYGFQKEAVVLAERITKLVLTDIKQTGGMHENYDAETGKPLAAPNFVSWNLLVGNMLDEAVTGKNPLYLHHEYKKTSELFSRLNRTTLIHTSDAFRDELVKTSQGGKTSLPCVVHPMSPAGLRDGSGVSFVIGGTMGKSATWRTTDSRVQIEKTAIFALPAVSKKDEFFRLLTQEIKEKQPILQAGISMAYPLTPELVGEQLDGRVIAFTKENNIEGLQGKLVGQELEVYLKKHKDITTNVSVANDTICLLLSGLGRGGSRDFPQIAGVVGTGLNFAFFDDATNWKNRLSLNAHTLVAINIESANFDGFEMSPAGKAIDESSENPGKAKLEKEVAGAYLYRLYNWTMKQAYGHKAHLITDTLTLSRIARQKRHEGQVLANQILERSAQLVAIELTGILKYLHKTQGRIEVIMTGSLFWQGEGYKEKVIKWLDIMLPYVTIDFVNVAENDIVGAAALANL
ncbi:hypothetical protein A3A64_01265 [Candidatus Gottesmanbacteria bacterium RIFCSPLOWO2_01_FULL_48_11]|uniref:Uncharacterized protein n=3 Tax=Candidatus Gottesmaniibacteriota TaxID=1752720 RepID=A0A0G1X189_9BACT|nr:MAG: hypothetical protein UY16_C0015G0020 [Candidatus Gottesmanbacteria bacterium GW2011_GWA2_47_9]KKU96343.1 MAG: hypothetical protein UY27_C0001G0036 [Candidatus Gottesmanbacteria bacterium GW2011_GWA1_48_13]OGG28091.1 MAG: hypothetical protein A3A64_01265 [Candidatus Gottesmanbacteria bacterium RIFCSPLOWO2_01_FULL_48_11]